MALWFTTDFAVSAQGFKAIYEGKTKGDITLLMEMFPRGLKDIWTEEINTFEIRCAGPMCCTGNKRAVWYVN